MKPLLESVGRRSLLLALAGLTLGDASQARQSGAPLQLAREATPDPDPAGWLVSEKYDGVRAWWDGRQLRFRSGLPVAAPAWFTAALPAVPLDGELWLGHGGFEALSGLVRRSAPDEAGWRRLRYMVFDLPGDNGSFAARHLKLQRLLANPVLPQRVAVAQLRLGDRAALRRLLAATVRAGGEGLMLHRADALWQSGRSAALLKLKPFHDAEALVIGHLPGRGRHVGRLGALRLRTPAGAEFSLGTGFSDAQREQPPALGSWVSYTHQGHTGTGLPRFARFLRQRGP